MTDHDDATVDEAVAGGRPVLPPSADPVGDARRALAARLVDEARATGVSLVSPDGLLADITRRVLETVPAIAVSAQCRSSKFPR